MYNFLKYLSSHRSLCFLRVCGKRLTIITMLQGWKPLVMMNFNFMPCDREHNYATCTKYPNLSSQFKCYQEIFTFKNMLKRNAYSDWYFEIRISYWRCWNYSSTHFSESRVHIEDYAIQSDSKSRQEVNKTTPACPNYPNFYHLKSVTTSKYLDSGWQNHSNSDSGHEVQRIQIQDVKVTFRARSWFNISIKNTI